MTLHRNDIADIRSSALATMQSLACDLGRAPTQNEYKSHAASTDAPTLSKVLYQFGTWTAAVTAAGLEPNDNRPPFNGYTDKDIVEEFVAVANRLGRMPTQAEFTRNAKYSVRPYTTRWGKWSQVKQHFGEAHGHLFTFECGRMASVKNKKSVEKELSACLPLLFEPRNEMETVVLFAMLAEELGYTIRAVRSDFPDAELESNGEIVFAEFEYESANYVQHGHPLDADCICICWRNTRDLGSIDVLALEDVLRNKRDHKLL